MLTREHKIDIFTNVKENLSILNVAEYYGIHTKWGGIACCPFHDDKTPSMKIYEESKCGDGHFHCYGCGAHGDVIGLTSQLFNLLPLEAARKLADDFKITIGNDREPPKPSIKAKMAHFSYSLQEQRAYKLLADYCDYLMECRKKYAPSNGNEELKPQFMKSLTELEKYKHYKDIFVTGTREERAAFMKDFAVGLDRIERITARAKQAGHVLE